ncbi:trafficking protein particle complex subunit 8-like [Tubulanus polymorphus]|uniref:trafficking protein particle complex subunit 8-like n=1 Tax=Tubulanus polymorphus TaxID=672921 RepID=UPI003DA3329B
MAQCKQTAHEFIQDAFSPMVAVLCSHDAEQVCQKNNLSFVEMTQPFCRLTQEAHMRDPGNLTHTMQNLRIVMKDMNTSVPQPTLARKLMSEAVGNTQPPSSDGNHGNIISVGSYDLQISSSTPWFEAYRETFLQVAFPSEHEFVRHFLACIFVVTSSHADPMDQFQKLSQQQHQQQHGSSNKLPKWFSPNILKYYVLLHDVVDGEESKAEAVYQSMKSMYGANACHLLQINSRSLTAAENMKGELTQMPDPWCQFLPKRINSSDAIDHDFSYSNQPLDMLTSMQSKQPVPSSRPDISNIEPASEATEDFIGQPNSVEVIDHPLARTEDDQSPVYTTFSDNLASLRDTNPLSNSMISLTDRARALQHGMCLTISDHDRLRIFIHEFIVRGLIPWAERSIRVLNEQLISRKGIHRSFFSATKKWFGSSKTPPGQQSPMQNTTVVYTQEAPELQMRRFADLAFMFQQYELAYQTYHSVKRDFQNDHAWLHFAGVMEMACLSIFMQGSISQRQYPNHYMDSSISTYLNTCKSPQFATRTTLMSTEALKSRGLYSEAAMQFIKMTSEDADLRSALLLEQAAHCFINMKVPMVRKYAFHMILAGHRFSKAGQRRHALRAYSQALQVYKGKEWTLAEDHINFTLGRQSFNLKQLENATAAFKHLLTRESHQTPAQQNAFLREYLFVYKQLMAQSYGEGITLVNGAYPQLPLPLIDDNSPKVLLSACRSENIEETTYIQASSVTFENVDTEESTNWPILEQLLLMSANNGTVSPVFKPTVHCYSNRTNNNHSPTAVVGEAVQLEVMLQNPLKVALVLSDVILLWKFQVMEYGEEKNQQNPSLILTNEKETNVKSSLSDEVIETQVIPEFILLPMERKPIHLTVIPKQTGELGITGIAYNLGSSTQMIQLPADSPLITKRPSFISTISIRGKSILEVQGPRLNQSKTEKTSKVYGPDCRLDLIIAPKMPLLEVKFHRFPESMLCGEIRLVTVEFENRGQISLHKLKVASSAPDFFSFGTPDMVLDEVSVYDTIPHSINNSNSAEEFVVQKKVVSHVIEILLPNNVLKPGAKTLLPMWIHGPVTSAIHKIDFLFYYESVEENPLYSYRILRHTATIETCASLQLTAVAQRACSAESDTDSKNLNTLIVKAEIENLNQIQDSTIIEFSILQLSCASQMWALHHLSTKQNSDIKVNPRESMMMSFKAHQSENNCENYKDVVFTNVTFDQHQIHSAGVPCADFYFRSMFNPTLPPCDMVSLSNSVIHSPDGLMPSLDETTPQQQLRNAVSTNMTLIALWKAFVISDTGESITLRGQHQVTLDTLDTVRISQPTLQPAVEQAPVKIIKQPEPPPNPIPDSTVVTQLVKYDINCVQRLSHDFRKNRLCIIPVRILLHNCSHHLVTVELDTSNSENNDSRNENTMDGFYHPRGCNQFVWLCQTGNHLTLGSQGTEKLDLFAGFSQPGVYNLSQLQVKVSVSELNMDFVTQKTAAPTLVVINRDTSD